MKLERYWSWLVVVATTSLVPLSVQANTYEIIDLGPDRQANQISDNGHIAGEKHTGAVWPTHWHKGHWHRLSRSSSGQSLAVNKHGQVAGSLQNWPTIWTHKVPRRLQLPDGAWLGEATGIANDGSSAGWFSMQFGGFRCYVAPPEGPVITEGFPDDPCYVTGMNSRGHVVGYGNVRDDRIEGFIYKGGKFKSLGALPGMKGSTAFGVNYFAQVVGYSGDQSVAHAFLWSDDVMTDIGQSALHTMTMARAINSHGEIVGHGQKTDSKVDALRFSLNGPPVSLASEVRQIGDWTLVTATSINDDGFIVGWGLRSGIIHAFMLQPVD